MSTRGKQRGEAAGWALIGFIETIAGQAGKLARRGQTRAVFFLASLSAMLLTVIAAAVAIYGMLTRPAWFLAGAEVIQCGLMVLVFIVLPLGFLAARWRERWY